MDKIFVSGAALAGVAALAGACGERPAEPARPNVVFILADDLGWGDVGCYGQQRFETPNIDALAATGMRFTQCYSGTTVSAPSRSCLITGTHSGHTAIRGNRELDPEGQFPLPEGAQTLFHDFRDAGYATGAFGKWGLGFIGSTGDPNRQGVDRFYGFNCQLLAHSYYPDHLWDNAERIDLSEINRNDTSYGTGAYAPDLIHAKALEFLDEAARDGKPFFLWYPTTIPHAELKVPEDSIIQRLRGKYPEKPYNGALPGSPYFMKGDYIAQSEPHATFAAMVTRLDTYVGEIVDRLKELGLYENTIIIFSSDNGPHREGGADPDFFDSNGPWRGYKRDVYEGGIRVPMIVAWPGHIKPGAETDFLCSFWDLMPTFRDLTGAASPEGMDGISLLPLLTGRKGQREHDYLYFEFQELGGRQALRQGPWKLVHVDIRTDKPRYELYNLDDDPGEEHDLAASEPERVAALKELMREAHVPNPDFPVLKGEDGSLSWGDMGDGRYRNPILLADYSDPDAIRVGDRYYLVASDFHFMGMQVLESDDLVNWRIISQIYDRFDLPGWDENAHYAGGSWAPSIRYHDGRFYVYFCTPDEGLFMSSAADPAGPWEPLHCVKAVYHWEDPCPFWDEDGHAYLGHSLHGAGPIIIHKMSADGKELLDDGVTVYRGPVAEGTKIHKWNGYYYMSIPEGGVGGGWQTVLRAKDIYGPYERKIVLETGSTAINGPHQGAIVDSPAGEWWFLHFQERDPLGRVVHLQPMHWENGWPVMGQDYDGNGVGEPVPAWQKPATAQAGARSLPASSDDFKSGKLGLQWQFNHNPVDEAWSVTRRKGALALDALQAPSFRDARNTLTQKIMGYTGSYTVRMDLADLADGQKAGLACMGRNNFLSGVRQTPAGRELFIEKEGEILASRPLEGKKLWLRLTFDATVQDGFAFAFSLDGKRFEPLGEAFQAHNGFWKGARVALYSYNESRNGGTAWFRDFVYD